MASCRRVQPIPQDFLHALCTNQISLHSLIPQLRPPVPPDKSQFILEAEPTAREEAVDAAVLRRILKDESAEPVMTHIPPNFPAYPSQHTYKSAPVFSKREEDPRKIRELAMEEGRLAEESIRRLLSASSGQISANPKADGGGKKSLRAIRDQMWKETMLAVGTDAVPGTDSNTQQDPERGDNEVASGATALERVYVSSAVNSDKRYWRKSATTPRTGAGVDIGGGAGAGAASAPSDNLQHK